MRDPKQIAFAARTSRSVVPRALRLTRASLTDGGWKETVGPRVEGTVQTISPSPPMLREGFRAPIWLTCTKPTATSP